MSDRAILLMYWYAVHNVTRALNSGWGERMMQLQKWLHKRMGGGFREMDDHDRVAELRNVLSALEDIAKKEAPF